MATAKFKELPRNEQKAAFAHMKVRDKNDPYRFKIKGREFLFHPEKKNDYWFTDIKTGKGAIDSAQAVIYGKPNKKNFKEVLSRAVNSFVKTEYGKKSGLFK